MSKLFVLITLGIAIISAHRLRREDAAAQVPNTQALLESGLTIAQEGVKKLEEIASNLISANSTDSLLQQGNTLLDKIKAIASSVTQTTQEWSENTSGQELREIANNALKGFKEEHPDLTNAVVGSLDKLNSVANDIILKLKLMVDDKDVKEISDTLIESTSSGINVLKEQLKETSKVLTETLKTNDAVKDVVETR
ncbi:hypothetical protein DOY81_001288 [Sarcophaga bullata]|nr:hypothetical protein DOY81_001288 [Sarcophaga bullata]